MEGVGVVSSVSCLRWTDQTRMDIHMNRNTVAQSNNVSRVFLRGAMRIQHLRCLKGSPFSKPICDFMGNNGKGMQGMRPKKRSNPPGHRRLAWQSVEYYGYDTAMFFKEKFKGLLRILGQG